MQLLCCMWRSVSLVQPCFSTGHKNTDVYVCMQFVFVFATAAACVGSQAMIRAAVYIIT